MGGGAGGTGRAPGPNLGQATSLPRERVREFQHEAHRYMVAQQGGGSVPPVAEHAPSDPMAVDSMQQGVRGMSIAENGYGRPPVAPQVHSPLVLSSCCLSQHNVFTIAVLQAGWPFAAVCVPHHDSTASSGR